MSEKLPLITVYEGHTLPLVPRTAKAIDILNNKYLSDLPQAPNPHTEDNYCFAITASSTEMKPDIQVGNTLFCTETKLDDSFNERNYCLVALGNDLHLRKLKKVDSGYSLIAHNKDHKTIVVPKEQINGVWYIVARHDNIEAYL